MPRTEQLLTPVEVAALLRIHVNTVYRLAEEGAIPGNKIGRVWRFSKSEVLALVIKKRRRSPSQTRRRGSHQSG